MLKKAFKVLDRMGCPLSKCQIRSALAKLVDEWPECGDMSEHFLELVPKSHLQLLWILGACRDPETGLPHVAPDGHLVCAFGRLGASFGGFRTAEPVAGTSFGERIRQRLEGGREAKGKYLLEKSKTKAAQALESRGFAEAEARRHGIHHDVAARDLARHQAQVALADAERAPGGLGAMAPSVRWATGRADRSTAAEHAARARAALIHEQAVRQNVSHAEEKRNQQIGHLRDVTKHVALQDLQPYIRQVAQLISGERKELDLLGKILDRTTLAHTVDKRARETLSTTETEARDEGQMIARGERARIDGAVRDYALRCGRIVPPADSTHTTRAPTLTDLLQGSKTSVAIGASPIGRGRLTSPTSPLRVELSRGSSEGSLERSDDAPWRENSLEHAYDAPWSAIRSRSPSCPLSDPLCGYKRMAAQQEPHFRNRRPPSPLERRKSLRRSASSS